MKFLLHIAFSIMLISSAVSQRLTGQIVSEEAQPLSGIFIQLDNTKFQTISDENGKFSFNELSAGTYTLITRSVNYQMHSETISLSSGETKNLTILLKMTTTQLDALLVESDLSTEDKASYYAARMPLKNLENPQVVSTVNTEIIQKQGNYDFTGILRNVPGVTKSWASVAPYFTVRGFTTRNYIRNGLSGYVAGELDPANTEQLEVVKGPAGTLFGSSLVSFGGLINRITKKPSDDTHTEVSFMGGNYGLSRYTVDANMPLNKDHSLLFRINLSHQYQGSFQDAGFLKTTFLAPSLFYQINERLSIQVDAEIYQREGTSATQISPKGSIQAGSEETWAKNPDELTIDYKKAYSNNSIRLKDPTENVYGIIQYQLSDQWKSQTNLVSSWTKNTGNFLMLYLSAGDSLMMRRISSYPTSHISTNQIQQNFIGDFQIGSMRNRMTIGLDYYTIANQSASMSLTYYDTLSLNGSNSNYEYISPELISSKLSGTNPTYTQSTQYTYSAYVSDVLNPIRSLSIMLSARVDRFYNKGTTNLTTGVTSGDYDQTSFSPKLGVVYQLLPEQISVFANYTNGFQNVAPVTQPDGTVSTFKPQYGNQMEGGFKTQLYKDRLTATVSYYNIMVKNTLQVDATTNNTIQSGTQYSRGIELDLQASPITGVLIKAGYAHNTSEMTDAAASVDGRRPVNSGPANTANWYIAYTQPSGRFAGLGAGLGGNYYDKNMIINNTTNGQFYTTAYTLLNANVYYDYSKMRIGLILNNLANKQYYTGGYGFITPGTLRQFMLNVTVKF